MTNVAEIILAQLGGNKFIAMTGARNFLKDERNLLFTIGKNLSKANRINIARNHKDLYDISLWRYNRKTLELDQLKIINDIQAENLKEVFTSETGLNTSL